VFLGWYVYGCDAFFCGFMRGKGGIDERIMNVFIFHGNGVLFGRLPSNKPLAMGGEVMNRCSKKQCNVFRVSFWV